MKQENISPAIDEHIAAFPASTQKLLQQLRNTIRKAAPDAVETIGYGIPTFKLNGNLVHFAGYNNHIGFYPGAAGIENFKEELSVYKGAKGSVQFPLDAPLPLALVTKIVDFRVKQNGTKPPVKKVVKPAPDLPANLSAPAKRALENEGITSIKKLSGYTEAAITALHGIGPLSIPKLKALLEQAGLAFKK